MHSSGYLIIGDCDGEVYYFDDIFYGFVPLTKSYYYHAILTENETLLEQVKEQFQNKVCDDGSTMTNIRIVPVNIYVVV